jgi:hypothetical protein
MFAAALKRISVGKGPKARIDQALIATQLSPDECASIVIFLTRHRAPVLQAFVDRASGDMSFLPGCGYFHTTIGRGGYVFLHTSEHNIRQ